MYSIAGYGLGCLQLRPRAYEERCAPFFKHRTEKVIEWGSITVTSTQVEQLRQGLGPFMWLSNMQANHEAGLTPRLHP